MKNTCGARALAAIIPGPEPVSPPAPQPGCCRRRSPSGSSGNRPIRSAGASSRPSVFSFPFHSSVGRSDSKMLLMTSRVEARGASRRYTSAKKAAESAVVL